jgi:hypothetical protein
LIEIEVGDESRVKPEFFLCFLISAATRLALSLLRHRSCFYLVLLRLKLHLVHHILFLNLVLVEVVVTGEEVIVVRVLAIDGVEVVVERMRGCHDVLVHHLFSFPHIL